MTERPAHKTEAGGEREEQRDACGDGKTGGGPLTAASKQDGKALAA